ncbi:hypothetical protein F5X99DRAFT_231300 [Biscogniauxia marginata]|nr:hypothetical protein F5X99DRAFT_231300 [Biscogniauxia marginata]
MFIQGYLLGYRYLYFISLLSTSSLTEIQNHLSEPERSRGRATSSNEARDSKKRRGKKIKLSRLLKPLLGGGTDIEPIPSHLLPALHGQRFVLPKCSHVVRRWFVLPSPLPVRAVQQCSSPHSMRPTSSLGSENESCSRRPGVGQHIYYIRTRMLRAKSAKRLSFPWKLPHRRVALDCRPLISCARVVGEKLGKSTFLAGVFRTPMHAWLFSNRDLSNLP